MSYQINKEPFNPMTLHEKYLLRNGYEYKLFQNGGKIFYTRSQNRITSLFALSAFLAQKD